MDNRIVRSSTRLASFSDGEKSEYYEGKIMYPFEALEKIGIELPQYIYQDGVEYVKVDFGYVRSDLKEEQDVKRGLYPGAIPSNFTFKIQFPEFCHIYNHRNECGTANPEVKKAVEMMAEQIKDFNPWLYSIIGDVKMQSETPKELLDKFHSVFDEEDI